jgi:hypothetical protein
MCVDTHLGVWCASITRMLPTVVGVASRCEKLGCNEAADVAFGIDRQACVVWLEHYDVDNSRHLNRLCDDHASRLTLPRGWSFDDRRETSPRLFVARTTATRAVVAKAASGRVVPMREAGRDATKGVARDATKGVARDATKGVARDATRGTRRATTKKTSTPRRTSRDTTNPLPFRSGPGMFDPTMPMPKSSPVSAPMPAATSTEPPETTLAPEDDPSSPMYVPKFDRSSDVGGVLNATGRLLSRAFSSQTRPIERPAVAAAGGDTDSFAVQGDHIDDFNQGDHVE